MMNLKILTLNCQKGYQPDLRNFLQNVLETGVYDFLLLQEFAGEVPSYVRDLGQYRSLEAHNNEVGELSHFATVYRDTFAFKVSELYPFSHLHPHGYLRHPGFGLLLGLFDTGKGLVRIGNIHLHSGLRSYVRRESVLRIKQHLFEFGHTHAPTIFGGDFNLGFPGELKRTIHTFAPEFVDFTSTLGPTLDSRYTEYHPLPTNVVATGLAYIGLGVRLRTDHLFVDRDTASKYQISCRVRPERVSDHSPVELVVEG